MIDFGEAKELFSEQVFLQLEPSPIIGPFYHVMKSSSGVSQVVVLLPVQHYLFEEISVLRGGGTSPMPNTQPGGSGLSVSGCSHCIPFFKGAGYPPYAVVTQLQ